MTQSERKMERDFSVEIESTIKETQKLVQEGNLEKALETLFIIEKQVRNAADLESLTKILIYFCVVCKASNNWSKLNEVIVLLSKKHGQLKQAITKMVQEAMTYLNQTPDHATKMELIETLRTVTEGKIYVEVERARLTKMLAEIREGEGKIAEAADILHDLQVETFGSMEKREKTEFILEQMRLCLQNNDLIRTLMISKKISTKYFADSENDDLKIRYYELLTSHALGLSDYLSCAKWQFQIYDTKSIKDSQDSCKTSLEKTILYTILSGFDNEQSDLLNRLMKDKNCEKIPLIFFSEFAKHFITHELVRWPKIDEIYGPNLKQSPVFTRDTHKAKELWEELHKRVVEHNIRVIAKYYSRITIHRLTELLDLDVKNTEEFLCKLVVNKTIFAKIDRPLGIIVFNPPLEANQVLDDWSADVNTLLGWVEKTNHLIAKEEMIHKIRIA